MYQTDQPGGARCLNFDRTVSAVIASYRPNPKTQLSAPSSVPFAVPAPIHVSLDGVPTAAAN